MAPGSLRACERDAGYAKQIGDIESAAAMYVGGLPSLSGALLRTHSQPLFVGVLTGVVTFFGSPGTASLGWPLVLWVFLLLVSLFLSLFSSPTLDSSGALARWKVAGPAWIVVLLLFLLLAWLAEPV